MGSGSSCIMEAAGESSPCSVLTSTGIAVVDIEGTSIPAADGVQRPVAGVEEDGGLWSTGSCDAEDRIARSPLVLLLFGAKECSSSAARGFWRERLVSRMQDGSGISWRAMAVRSKINEAKTG